MAPHTTLQRLKSTLQITNDYTHAPAGLHWRSNTLFIIATVAIGLFTDLFLYGLVVPILPFMLADRVGLPQSQIQSHVDGLLAAYAGASVLFSPVAGFLADKTSTRQSPFLLGLAALLMATVLLFLGHSVAVLAVARVLQGVSAAVVWTIGLALCLETVGPENLGKTIGSIFSFISVGSLLSPLLGGILYQKAGYAGVFGIGFGVLAIDFLMRLLVIEKKVARRYHTNDDTDRTGDSRNTPQSPEDEDNTQTNDEEHPLLGKKQDRHYNIPPNQSPLSHKIPLLPCLKNPSLLAALLLAFMQALLLGSFDATIPTVAQELFALDPLKAGVLFLPLGASDLILGPIAGWAVDRYGTKPAATLGYLYLALPLVLLRLPHAGGTDQVVLYGGLLALCGAGLAVVGAPSIVEAGSIVQKYYEANPEFFGEAAPYAQLYGLNSMVFSLGLTVGPELAGELKQGVGYGNMNLVVAGICAGTAVLGFLFIGGRPRLPGVMRRGDRCSV